MGNCYVRLFGFHKMETYPETWGKFEDGIRSVDYVLAYNGNDINKLNLEKRKIFEYNLAKEGLLLERDKKQRIHFLKIHAPPELLYKYAEILKIKFPLIKIPGQEKIIGRRSSLIRRSIQSIAVGIFNMSRLNKMKFPPRPYRIYYPYSRDYHNLFDWQQTEFLRDGIRNAIVRFILERQYFDENEETINYGIDKLVHDRVYDSAYILHNEHERDLLLREWANIRKWKNIQPLDNIKDYFGPKVGLYYAWLGFYTQMLIPMSIFGVLSFIYGLVTLRTDKISSEICNDNKTTLMCPLCDRNCDFWQLETICKSARMNYVIDNDMTVIYAFVTSVWAVMYLSLWKRYCASLIHRWGLTGFTKLMEHPRKEFLVKTREHPEFNSSEQDVPYWSTKFLPSFTSYSVMILFICISVIWIFTMIVYRMAQKAAHSILGGENAVSYKILLYPWTVSIIGFTMNYLLNSFYQNLAPFLTNYEYCRTETEHEQSLTVKLYTFQFVNFYSWLFYMAFLKGKFVGYPAKYNRVLGLRQDECSPGGCLMDLCMLLATAMIYKQALGAAKEMTIPYIKRTIRRLGINFGLCKRPEEKLIPTNQWAEEYHLLPWAIYSEYLEMALQFGFVTLFGLAFPLAPLFALINNVLEMRLDGLKMLTFCKRPAAQRATDIGVWYNLLLVLTKIAVFSNAMIIAFSTNLIPKLIYRTSTHDFSLDGYLNFTLAYFNTEDFEIKPRLSSSLYKDATSCRYAQIRNPPTGSDPYGFPLIYWKILAARLAFIVIFQNLIFMLQGIVAWAIPDVPQKILKRIMREDSLLFDHILEYERESGVLTGKAAAEQHTADEAAQWATATEAGKTDRNNFRQ